MKCVCGYEYISQYSYNEKRMVPFKGDKSFIQYKISCVKYEEEYMDSEPFILDMFSCPKCGTLKVEV